MGKRAGVEAGRAKRGAYGAGQFRRGGSGTDGGRSARGGDRATDVTRRTGGGVLFLDRERSGAIAENPVRRTDRAGLRRRRWNERFHSDSRFARERPGGFHTYGRGKASAV